MRSVPEMRLVLPQVKTRKRYSVDKSLLHSWLDSYETYRDMRDLENRNGMRWLTHECDDGRYGQAAGRQAGAAEVLKNTLGMQIPIPLASHDVTSLQGHPSGRVQSFVDMT